MGGSGDGSASSDGTKGAPGLTVAGGSVTLKGPAAVYGGAGGQSIDGKNGGTGGDGAVLTSSTLTIEEGALIQGGNGGDAVVSSGTQGTGGAAGVSLSGEGGTLNNAGGPGETAEDKDGALHSKSAITLRPGNPGLGYTYTPAEIPDNGDPITEPVTGETTPGPNAAPVTATAPTVTAVTGASLTYGYAADSGSVVVTATAA